MARKQRSRRARPPALPKRQRLPRRAADEERAALGERVASTDVIPDEPPGFELVRAMSSTIGVAATGHVPGEDIDEARMRLHDSQVALAALGYDSAGVASHSPDIEGVWGPETSEALLAFQSDQDLPETGQLDPETYEALMAAYEGAIQPESREVDEDWEESLYGFRSQRP